MKLKVGIFFGGPSRLREQSFAGALNIYRNLDGHLFEVIPIFVDIHGTLVQIDEKNLNKKRLQHFFAPSVAEDSHSFSVYQESIPEDQQKPQVQQLGTLLSTDALPQLINFAFVGLEGAPAQEQTILETLLSQRIPFMGPSISALDAYIQLSKFKHVLREQNWPSNNYQLLRTAQWQAASHDLLHQIQEGLPRPWRISPDIQNHQLASSNIGKNTETELIQEQIERAFYIEKIPLATWKTKSTFDRRDHLQYLSDLEVGLGYPIRLKVKDQNLVCHHPQTLLNTLNSLSVSMDEEDAIFELKSELPSNDVLIEEVPQGRKFKCIVIDGESGSPFALYPQELSGSHTQLTQMQFQVIQRSCEQLYQNLTLGPCVQFEGVLTAQDNVFIELVRLHPLFSQDEHLQTQLSLMNWPFRQFLTYLVLQSLARRSQEYPKQMTFPALRAHLLSLISQATQPLEDKISIALVLAYEKEVSTPAWQAIQYFKTLLAKKEYYHFFLYQSTGASPFLLESLSLSALNQSTPPHLDHFVTPPLLEENKEKLALHLKDLGIGTNAMNGSSVPARQLKADFVYLQADASFQNGKLHRAFQESKIPVSGSSHQVLSTCYQRVHALSALKKHGLQCIPQLLVRKLDFLQDIPAFINSVERSFSYPFEVHTGDHDAQLWRCKIHSKEELMAYAKLIFRPVDSQAIEARKKLQIPLSKEVPIKDSLVVQSIYHRQNPQYLAIRASLITTKGEQSSIQYKILGISARQQQQWLPLESLSADIAGFAPLREQLEDQLIKAAEILNLSSYACIESYLRIFGDNSIELIFSNINALPFLVPDHLLFQDASRAGFSPRQILEQIVSFGLTRKLPLQKTTSEPTMVNDNDLNEASNLEAEESTTSPIQKEPDKKEPSGESFVKRTWKEVIAFLTASIFWKNLGAIVGLALLLFFLVTGLLGWYTHHGKSYVVEDYVGMSFDEAKRKARGRTFKAVIIDSIFIVGEPANIVKDQDPEPNSKVKKRRTIYMWVTGGEAPEISLPSLAGKDDFETYRRELERQDINLVVKERKFERKLEENTILSFFYQGKEVSIQEVSRGFKVKKGSKLEAVVSYRTSNQVNIPNLVCQTFEDAKFQIEGNRLKLGQVYGTRNNSSYVWKQEPAYLPDSMVNTGTTINLHLTTEKPDGCQ